MTNDCKTCPVSTGTHQPAEALHQIAEPDAQHLQELAAYRFTVENLRARVTELEAQLAEETDAADNWRRLALQFDNHRMQAIGHLKAVTNPDACFDKYKAAKEFLNAPPLDGEAVLAQRIAAIAATHPTQQGMDAQDAARFRGFAACMLRQDCAFEDAVEAYPKPDFEIATIDDVRAMIDAGLAAVDAAQAKQGEQANG